MTVADVHHEVCGMRAELAELRQTLKIGCCGIGFLLAALAAQVLLVPLQQLRTGARGMLQLLCALALAFVAARRSASWGSGLVPKSPVPAAADAPAEAAAGAAESGAAGNRLRTELAGTATPGEDGVQRMRTEISAPTPSNDAVCNAAARSLLAGRFREARGARGERKAPTATPARGRFGGGASGAAVAAAPGTPVSKTAPVADDAQRSGASGAAEQGAMTPPPTALAKRRLATAQEQAMPTPVSLCVLRHTVQSTQQPTPQQRARPPQPVQPDLQQQQQQQQQQEDLGPTLGGKTPRAPAATRTTAASCPPNMANARQGSCSTPRADMDEQVGSPCTAASIGGAVRFDIGDSGGGSGIFEDNSSTRVPAITQARTCPKAPDRVPAAWKRHELRRSAGIRNNAFASGAGMGAAGPPSPSPLLVRRSDGLGLELSVCKQANPASNVRGSDGGGGDQSGAAATKNGALARDKQPSSAGQVKPGSFDSFIPFKLAGSPPLFSTKVSPRAMAFSPGGARFSATTASGCLLLLLHFLLIFSRFELPSLVARAVAHAPAAFFACL